MADNYVVDSSSNLIDPLQQRAVILVRGLDSPTKRCTSRGTNVESGSLECTPSFLVVPKQGKSVIAPRIPAEGNNQSSPDTRVALGRVVWLVEPKSLIAKHPRPAGLGVDRREHPVDELLIIYEAIPV